MQHFVFISHSARDKRAAEEVCAGLENDGIPCWVAPRNIPPGDVWGEAIVNAITQSEVILFIFSAQSNNSSHVQRELECAVSQGIRIIPYRIEDVPPTGAITYFTAGAQWLDATAASDGNPLNALRETIGRLLTEVRPDKPTAREAERCNLYERAVAEIEELLVQNKRHACVRRCGALFERGMKHLIAGLLQGPDAGDVRNAISAAEQKIATGVPFGEMGLRQLISLYQEAGIIEWLRRHLTSNLHLVEQIDWQRVQRCCEAAQEPQMPFPAEDDPAYVVYWVKLFTFDCELVGSDLPMVVQEKEDGLTECPHCHEPLQHQWRFCPQCSTRLKVSCDSCHRRLQPDFRICPYCEQPVCGVGPVQPDEVRMAQEEYRMLCVGVYLDGCCNVFERRLLDRKRLELGLRIEDAQRIERACCPGHTLEYARLVEGALVDGVISDTERSFLRKKAQELGVTPWQVEEIERVAVALRQEHQSRHEFA